MEGGSAGFLGPAFAVLVGLSGLLVVGLGFWGLARPVGLQAFVANWDPGRRFVLAVVRRVAFGGVLLGAAPTSRFPFFLQALGVLSLVAAVGVFLSGGERLDTWAKWWSHRSASVVRTWSGAAALAGAFLVYTVT